MAKNEKTSKRAAAIAGRLLQRLEGARSKSSLHIGFWNAKESRYDVFTMSAGDLKALAASALTQTADKKTKKA